MPVLHPTAVNTSTIGGYIQGLYSSCNFGAIPAGWPEGNFVLHPKNVASDRGCLFPVGLLSFRGEMPSSSTLAHAAFNGVAHDVPFAVEKAYFAGMDDQARRLLPSNRWMLHSRVAGEIAAHRLRRAADAHAGSANRQSSDTRLPYAAFGEYMTSGLLFAGLRGRRNVYNAIEAFDYALARIKDVEGAGVLRAVANECKAKALQIRIQGLSGSERSAQQLNAHLRTQSDAFSAAAREWLDVAKKSEANKAAFEEAIYAAQYDAYRASDFGLLTAAFMRSAEYYLGAGDEKTADAYRARAGWSSAMVGLDFDLVVAGLDALKRVTEIPPAGPPERLEFLRSVAKYYADVKNLPAEKRADGSIVIERTDADFAGGLAATDQQSLERRLMKIYLFGDTALSHEQTCRLAFRNLGFQAQQDIVRKIASDFLTSESDPKRLSGGRKFIPPYKVNSVLDRALDRFRAA